MRPPRAQVVGLTAMLVGAAVFFVHCRRKHPRSFKQACKDLAAAVRKSNCSALYRVLDEKTRWAVMSLVRDAKKVRALILENYPEDKKARELARVSHEASAKNAEQWVTRYCVRTQLFKAFEELGRKPRKVIEQGKQGTMISATGRKVRFVRDAYGQWGCDIIRKRVTELHVRMANLLKMTVENAKYYRKKGAR